MDKKNLRIKQSQFEGCLLGVLLGDCLGYPYENESSIHVTTRKIQEGFDQLLEKKGKSDFQYTDDASMTKTLTKFILNSGDDFNAKVLAQKFTEGYNEETRSRSYGSNVQTVFMTLLETNYQDPFKPSHDQFNGTGSLGNGAGMRVAPMSLMTIHEEDTKNFVELTNVASRITHAHPQGLIGGIFQALAVRQALLFGVDRIEGQEDQKSTRLDILNSFENEFNKLSPSQFPFAPEQGVRDGLELYKQKLQTIRQLLNEGNQNVTIDKIKNLLGVKVTAPHSIPTAFYCFLAAFEEIPFVETDNQFQRTIQLAISCGGDTDTIGSMAGAISGAYLGSENISVKLTKHCEDHTNFQTLGQRLYKRYKTIIES